MSRSHRVGSIEEFGTMLLDTEDLDPLYVALVGAQMPEDQMKRWLFAYWCCYHAGTSCYISESPTPEVYWSRMLEMASNQNPNPLGTRWPRGHERRHFRGGKAMDAVVDYCAMGGTPENLVDDFIGPRGQEKVPYAHLRARVTKLPQFGPWIAFKVADMLERVLGVPVDFSEADVLMFDQPYKSALQVFSEDWKMMTTDDGPSIVKFVAHTLGARFGTRVAPPVTERDPRMVGLQEVETILCKWKSHKSGHYPVGIDSHDLREGLQLWAKVSPTAAQMLSVAPRGDLNG
jgi:hypothetical protein